MNPTRRDAIALSLATLTTAGAYAPLAGAEEPKFTLAGGVPRARLAWKESDGNLSNWCWVNPGSEKRMTDAIEKALKK